MIRVRSPKTFRPGFLTFLSRPLLYRMKWPPPLVLDQIYRSQPRQSFIFEAQSQSMRTWLVLFMISIGLLTPLLRPALRSTIFRAALKPLNNLIPSKLNVCVSGTVIVHTATMSNLASAVAATAPPDSAHREPSDSTTSDTRPAEPELAKLSTADFRIYNRLAVMMDAYVGLIMFPPVHANIS